MKSCRTLAFCLCILFLSTASLLGLEGPAGAKPNSPSGDYRTFTRDVNQALLSESWPKCVSACDNYLSKHPDDPRIRAVRGYALLQYNRESQSIADLSAAIKSGISDLPCDLVEDHASSLLSLRGFALMRVGRLKEGIADIERTLKNKPLLVSTIFNRRGDYQNLSAAYSRLGDRARAAQCSKVSAEMENQMQSILQPRIANQSDAKAAIAKLKRECAASPKSSIAWTKMTVYLIYLSNWAEALKSVDSAIAMEPFLSRTHLMRLEILKNLHRDAEAKAEAASILKNASRPSGSAESAGDRMLVTARMIEIYKKFDDLDGQIKVLENVASGGTAGESQLYDLAQCYARKKQWVKAVEAYGEALEFATDNQPLILEQRAKAHKMLGHSKEADKDIAEAYRLRHKNTKI